MKKFTVGLLYLLALLAAMTVLAALGTLFQFGVLTPLLGVDWAEGITTVLMIIGGGMVGHVGRLYWDDVKEWAKV